MVIKSKKNESEQSKIQNVKQIIKSNDYLKQVFAEQFEQNKDFQDDYLITNYRQFDKFFHGIKKHSFNIIFGTTSAGKTAFALNLMMKLRNKSKQIRAVFYSLEMNKFDIDRRLLSIVSHVGLDELQAKKSIVKKSFDTQVNKFFVDDEKQTELDSLIQKIKQHYQQQPIDLVIVDYLQILSFKKAQNNYEKVTQASRELQKLSTELKITIIAISQTNRRADRREKGKPLELHHLLDSSVISQSADLIISLDSTLSYHPDIVLCDVQKNRNGSTGKIEFIFDKQNMVFSERKEQ